MAIAAAPRWLWEVTPQRSGMLMPETPDPSFISRKRLVRAQFEPDPNLGSAPSGRTVDALLKQGVVVLDKPAGPTSHQVAAWARDRITRVSRWARMAPTAGSVMSSAGT